MLPAFHGLKILRSVVLSVAVLMVDNRTGRDPTMFFLPDGPMF
jgi:hypothetical protein